MTRNKRIKHLPRRVSVLLPTLIDLGSPVTLYGYIIYHRNGLVERRRGPSIISPTGTKWYCQTGMLHRVGGPAYVQKDGHKEWWFNNTRHRHLSDGPAVIRADGRECWFENGGRHRDGKPAVVGPRGFEVWWQNGLVHRVGGPAQTLSDGSRYWVEKGKIHRMDGPALILSDGTSRYFKDNKEIPRHAVSEILARHQLSPDSTTWSEADHMIVALALP